jgi:hypothetical protein
MVTYDPRGMTWDQWCPLMNELFAAQNLGVVPEDQWESWANAMSGFGSFQSSGVGDSRGFDTWQDWAYHLIGTMVVN